MDLQRKRARHAAYMRAYNADPRRREEKRQRDLVYAATHREEARVRSAAWLAANPERARDAARARYERTKVLIGRPRADAHANWRGDQVGYHALHVWLAANYGKPSLCEHCGTTTAKRFEWANVDHVYRRVREDWMRLCTSCHRKYDYAAGICRAGSPNRR